MINSIPPAGPLSNMPPSNGEGDDLLAALQAAAAQTQSPSAANFAQYLLHACQPVLPGQPQLVEQWLSHILQTTPLDLPGIPSGQDIYMFFQMSADDLKVLTDCFKEKVPEWQNQPQPYPPTPMDILTANLVHFLNGLPTPDQKLINAVLSQCTQSNQDINATFENWLTLELSTGASPFSDYGKLQPSTISFLLNQFPFSMLGTGLTLYLNNGGWAAASNPPSSPSSIQTFQGKLSEIIAAFGEEQPPQTFADFQTYLNQNPNINGDLCFQISGIRPQDIESFLSTFGLQSPYSYQPIDDAYACIYCASQTIGNPDASLLSTIASDLFTDHRAGSYNTSKAAIEAALANPSISQNTRDLLNAALNAIGG